MAVDSSTSVIDSLLEKLKLDDPWVPPRSWDSLPYLAGASSKSPSHSPPALYSTSIVSEPSLVRLAMNALHGVESALISIEKLSAVLCYSSADRSSCRIPNLWARSSSTTALGNLLVSIGHLGCLVFILHRFVKYFTAPDVVGINGLEGSPNTNSCNGEKLPQNNLTLINQAFAISVGKVVDGYISALNTLSASVKLRRHLKTNVGGSLTCIGHPEITLLEVYLHTMGLSTQIEALGNICNVNHLIVDFPVSSLEYMKTKADIEFSTFPRSGALLSFLYAQLKIADPGNLATLKFLFIRSYEPYSDFIRTWIFDGSVNDPYHEFVVECINEHSSNNNGISSGSPLPTIRVRDAALLPCFLEECLIPLCRTGQQLQVITKLLELSNNVGTYDAHEEILPSLVGLSSDHLWFQIPLSFRKGTIERMIHMRANYYHQLLEKVESILIKLDFSEQVACQSVSLKLLNNLKKNQNLLASSTSDENLSSPTYRRNQHVNGVTVYDDVSSTMDEYSYNEYCLESSECSSSEGYEEQNEVEKINFASGCVEPTYLSALHFSSGIMTEYSIESLKKHEILEADSVKIKWNPGNAAFLSPSLISEKNFSETSEIWAKELHLYPSDGHDSDQKKCDAHLHPTYQLERGAEDCVLLKTKVGVSEVPDKDHHLHLLDASSKAFRMSELKYDSTFFSMNPLLNRGSILNLRAIFGERSHATYKNSYFHFNSVQDPLEACNAKLAGDRGHEFVTQLITETSSGAIDSCGHTGGEISNDDAIEKNAELYNTNSPLHKESRDEENLLFPNTSGGGAWESLLGKYRNVGNRSTEVCQMESAGEADLPLDFVIKKCVMDEILLQYDYVSKLTIKLLIEGFKLQEHLQALRCYHFMELADWADLFIMSLWHHKWHVNDVEKRIPEIQGVLELALQRSSCESDPNKDRLFVYHKGDEVKDLLTSHVGIHYFDFLGLGYRIDWPVNIILTPGALDAYSEIFNFLIQVKLAAFSLSDAWSSLKGYHLKKCDAEVHHFSLLTETRHKLNHFVSTLQQYVQSQLSQVSWYRFLHSLKHKVKDMTDLESVHMTYLSESLLICFLSKETQPIAGIIRSILQCAIDFRSCLNGSMMGYGSSDANLTNRLHIDIAQVHSIRSAFAKNVEDLYLIYVQSPKHSEFSVSRFWDYLNYNEYYGGAMSKKMGNSIFSP
ncbi:uncharacterized protein LOC127258835 [Andrographis paniculata]|uniref:uncharacterized protein LOC127258835 n=1 Tax=Andrographis paniculata TaxID=175694 RepID=UPI0021E91A9C|nr:uncharacterized protein LOC127258835 [Andrographis paniculata]XP_051141818.1 uncharacterized protein LOC127258835 [Andrographis paniculata]